jgi:hypothetical protein
VGAPWERGRPGRFETQRPFIENKDVMRPGRPRSKSVRIRLNADIRRGHCRSWNNGRSSRM